MNPEAYAAKRLKGVEMSAIRLISDRARALRAQGHEVALFSMGEPDFDTPAPIKEAAKRKIDENRTHYTSNRGAAPLRAAIAERILEDTGVCYDPENEILLTCGGAEAINNGLAAFLDAGDEAIVLAPAVVSYRNSIRLCGAVPVEVALRPEAGFPVCEEDLEAAVTERTKMIVLNNPSNPAGTVLSVRSLEAVRRVAMRHDLLVFSDEIYSRLVYEGTCASIASLPGMRERTLMMNGFSKTYAMTGWRVGYLAYPAWMDGLLLRVHQYSTTTGVTFLQEALAESMNRPDTLAAAERMRAAFDARRRLAMALLDEIPALRYVRPQGAFYILIDVRGTGMDGGQFARRALEEAHVALVPAASFGGDCAGFVRMSYAAGEEEIRAGLARLKDWLDAKRRDSHVG